MIEGELPASVEGLRRLAFDLGGVRDRVTAVERAVAGRLLPFDTGPGDLVGFDADGNPVLIDAAAGDGYGLTSDTLQTGGVKWVDRGTTDTAQTAVTYATDWADLGGGYETVRYRRRDGYLYINGMCKKVAGTGTSLMFTLPVGFRPANHHVVTCIPMVAGALNDAHIYILSTGAVSMAEAGIVAGTVVAFAPISVCIPLS